MARIGSLDLEVPLGIGTMFWGEALVDSMMGDVPPMDDLHRVVDVATSAKITLFDTAEGYGGGTSESRLAEALSGRKAVIMTKFLPAIWRWTEASFFNALAQCTKRLSRPIDVFYIHTPMHPRFEFWVECACNARQQGYITEIGLSNCNAKQVETAVKIASDLGQRISANQVLFSLLSYGSESLKEMERVCKRNDITIIAYSVLGQGLLTDNLTVEKFKTIRAAKMTGVKYEQLQSLRAAIASLALKYNVTMAQICLNWAIQKGTIPLVGIKNERHLKDALGSLTFVLTAEEVASLDTAALSKATLDKSLLRRMIFMVLLSTLIFVYYSARWVPKKLYLKEKKKKN